MAVLRPGGAHAAAVDHCAACRLVWFEALEFDALDRLAWVRLLQALIAPPAVEPEPAGDVPQWRCTRCREPLAEAEGLTRHGRYGARRCRQGHGQALGLPALLASRGLLRPPATAERVALAREGRALHCLSCGAPETAHDDRCAHCQAPLQLLDLPRLAVALGQRDEAQAARERPTAGSATDPPLQRWPCHACGQVLDPARDIQCPQCAHPVLAPALEDVQPMLEAAEARLGRVQEQRMRTALDATPVSEHRRIAALTQRPEHQAAAERAVQSFWRRYGLVAAAFGATLLVALCNAR
jgi:hypothetical protein